MCAAHVNQMIHMTRKCQCKAHRHTWEWTLHSRCSNRSGHSQDRMCGCMNVGLIILKKTKYPLCRLLLYIMQWSLINDYVRNVAHRVNCMHFSTWRDSAVFEGHTQHTLAASVNEMHCVNLSLGCHTGNYTQLIFQMWMGCVQLNTEQKVSHLM